MALILFYLIFYLVLLWRVSLLLINLHLCVFFYYHRNGSPRSSRTSSPVSTTSKRSLSPITKSLNSLSVSRNTFAQVNILWSWQIIVIYTIFISHYFSSLQKLKDSNKEGPWKKRATVSESEASCSHSGNLISDAVEAALEKARLEKESKGTIETVGS